MSLELGRVFNGGAEWASSSRLVGGVLRNPVSAALLITAIALIIIYAMYKEQLRGTGKRRGMKTVFWLTIATSALVFAHYYVLQRALKKEHMSEGLRTTMDSIHHSATTGGGYAVLPALRSEEADETPRFSLRKDNLPPEAEDFLIEDVVLSSTINK